MTRLVVAVIGAGCLVACGSELPNGPASPSGNAATTTVRFTYQARTTPRTDFPPSLSTCVSGVGQTHMHPSWRSFAAFPLTAAAADRWEISFSDVPIGARQSFRINDGNACDQNATGATTQNIFANDVRLTEIVTTPGTGPEPGLAFSVDSAGRVTP